jgi:dienelactone hydrolase
MNDGEATFPHVLVRRKDALMCGSVCEPLLRMAARRGAWRAAERMITVFRAMALAAVAWVGAATFPSLGASAAEWREERIEIATRPGVTQVFYLARPEGEAAATLLLFTGGDGKLRGMGQPPNLATGNFLVRSRGLFLEQGFATATIDAPSDQSGGMKNFVASRERAANIAVVVAWLNERVAKPVWLVGTSRGSISAALGAAKGAAAKGVVLTSSITREAKWYPATVYDAGLDGVRVPALVVHHRGDACAFTPFVDTAHLLGSLKNAPRKELIAFEGGAPPRTEPCEALAAHGYFGLEREVVAAIAGWIKQQED